jgi:DNA processing protein
MSDPRDWIAAIQLPGMGASTLARLADAGVAAFDLFNLSPSDLKALSLRSATRHALTDSMRVDALFQQADTWIEQAHNHGWTLLALDHPFYPDLLRQLTDPPALLWVWGSGELLSMPQLAMVGSRQATREGLRSAYRFADELTKGGLIITSGLARGIDGAAHQAAVDNRAATLAVLGTGLDQLYPRANQTLARSIVEYGGAIVSEYPPGTAPRAGHFPRRNRIISGLSVGTLVVEAATRSGSLITARQALENGREVFALPGSIHNPLSRGCHALIKEGAHLVETSHDILAQLGPMLGALSDSVRAPSEEKAEEPDDPLLASIPFSPVGFDQLAQEHGLQAGELQQALMRLELQGLIEMRGAMIQRC